MAFSESAAHQLLVACKRHCCVCWRRCGFRIELHHIVPLADGGPDDIENAIPVCFDCHAEIESTGPRGRRFRAEELREHKRRWIDLVANSPSALIAAAQQQAETGPLEALLAELEYNLVAATLPSREGFPPFAVRQFDRTIATNAIAALPENTRRKLLNLYGFMNRLNYHLQEMIAVDRSGGHGSAYASVKDVAGRLRDGLVPSIREVIPLLATALGRSEESAPPT
jgi:hypothetical protein